MEGDNRQANKIGKQKDKRITNDGRRRGRGHQSESVPTEAAHHRRVLQEGRLLPEHYEESVVVVELLLLRSSTNVVFVVVVVADEIVRRRCPRRWQCQEGRREGVDGICRIAGRRNDIKNAIHRRRRVDLVSIID